MLTNIINFCLRNNFIYCISQVTYLDCMLHLRFRLFFSVLFFYSFAHGQQVDTTFRYEIEKPYKGEQRIRVGVDTGHNNRHTCETGLLPLCRLLAQDGFITTSLYGSFKKNQLDSLDVLVIVNALHASNIKNWTLPCPSAFTDEEVKVINQWVRQGGNLFLSADHMPYGGAVEKLAESFDVRWSNSFVMRNGSKWPPSVFVRKEGTLLPTMLTDSSEFIYQIERIGSFTGSAFSGESLVPFLVFDNSHRILYPETAWRFNKKTKNESASGWMQGAFMIYGEGKIVFMGESAMFTAQKRENLKIGFNSPDVPENIELALNVFRFLAENPN